MSEIKQMYLNAYYGKSFVEKALPEVELEANVKVDPRDFKKVYNENKKSK